jgi:hypothetical protein
MSEIINMRNGGVGQGWHPEEPDDDMQALAIDLMKSTLAEVFNKIKEHHKNGTGIRGVNGPRWQ